ncbi:Rieske (2Fe-2S) protein [Nocardioides sp. JQ2195]|uniref:Rieske (2Fe-2S) protein n=1 Tax=Nocardioides sp. JQ2195 TaxID=2592334 RepID=UPI00143ED0CF|nr:Rieske (2Fe-2S) protein [Nocardioides sp. JQ2195]QIX26806.1 Rieske (2Fe-2S) protein [Nocardioides sp. JQ2195]
MDSPSHVTRRGVLSGAAAGLSLPLLAACSSSGDSETTSTDPASASSTSNGSTGPGSGDAGTSTQTESLVSAADVPEGGGVILDDLVVTQPTTGEFRAFSSTCTHMQCKVSSIDSSIHCACHGSQFSIVDGAVEAGPATAALPEQPVRRAGRDIIRS